MNARSKSRRGKERPTAPLPFSFKDHSTSKEKNRRFLLSLRRVLLKAKGQWTRATHVASIASLSLFVSLLIVSSRHRSFRSIWSVSSFQSVDHLPRCVRHVVDDGIIEVRRLNTNDMKIYPTKRTVHISKKSLRAQGRLDESREYEYGRADDFETEDCQAQYEWQKASFPTCNLLHEMDLNAPENRGIVANGYWRDVWVVNDMNNAPQVMKTMRYVHNFEERNYDRHRRDAVAAERLTKSKFVVDIYGSCFNSGIFEYSTGGDIIHAIWKQNRTLTQSEKLRIATQTATGIAEVHNVDKEGRASIAHTDISPSQFILVDGIYKLNDFNRARFIRWSVSRNKPCGYYITKNPGKNRSPEEYLYEEQTEKVDVFSLGNIFYMLLQEEWPFEDVDSKEAQRLVKEGYRPSFYADVWNSTDPVNQALKEAMIMCHEQNASERATARDVEIYLKNKMKKLYP